MLISIKAQVRLGLVWLKNKIVFNIYINIKKVTFTFITVDAKFRLGK
jgi:hypothetical protein